MAKYLVQLLLIACVANYVVSLKCLSCTSKEACENNPPSTKCTPEKKLCVAVVSAGTYFRGCYDNTMDCDKLKKDPKVDVPVCKVCSKDNCNNQKFP